MFDALIREAATRFGLGDKAPMLVQMLLAYMTNKDTGGLAGFIDKFKGAGLGAMANSWLGGHSSAQSVTPSQIEQVLGGSGGLLGMLTSKLGITGPMATSALSFLLPAVMGKLTPGGSLPTSIPHDVLGFIGGAKNMLAGGVASAAGAASAGAYAAGDAAKSAGGGLMKWLPWIVAAAAALFLLNYCSKPAVDATKKAVEVTKDAAVATSTAATAAAGAVVDSTKTAVGTAADATKAVAGAAADSTKAAVGAATDATKAVAGAAADAAKAVADAIPTGSGALSKLINGVPSLNIYFDSGKTDLPADMAAKSADVVKYLKDNAAAKALLAGFHDPQGNKAANEELAKNRAKAVAASLAAAGIAADRITMQKPVESTGTGGSNAEARRVEITIQK